jgi:ATP-dependent DNA helicase RecG
LDGNSADVLTITNLLKKHASKPYNPELASTLFRSGYIESWGRGIEKMMNYCLEAGIPTPNYSFEGSDFLVEFRKDIYHEEYLTELGLNERQIKAVLFVKEKGKITNSDYQELNQIGKTTATEELAGLVNLGVLIASTLKGRGAKYTIE